MVSRADAHQHHFRTLQRIRVPRIMRAIGWLLAASVVIWTLFLVYAPWVQTAPGRGSVIALNPNDRVQEINALVPGRIQQWYVRDGSHVKSGDPIMEIVDNDPQLIERLRAERAQVVAKLNAAEAAMQTAELDLRRTRELFEAGLAARREFEQASIRIDEMRSRVAEAAAELTRADVNLSRQSVQTVRAPRDGTILRVNAGDAATFVSAGQVVASFVPDNAERAIELFIDGRDVALMAPGRKVRLQFEGWPVVQFSGWPSVAVGTFGGEVVAIDPSADAAGRFRVLVTEDKSDPHPWPDASYVRFGAKARGWVLLDTVSVGYEIWRQLNNFPPNFPAGSGDGL
ncbi:MAG TPA: efflux RND transporter periplasmic adaptor subunit [Pseudomonadales bacterium]|nr:efflux RND transporter periplasmic adaptor subunit [Pseudomonadales bacterium]